MSCFFASQSNTFEAFELSESLFDPCACFVERCWKDFGLVLFIVLMGDDGHNPPLSRCGAIGLAGIAFVADGRARRDVGADVQQGFEMARV